MNVVRDESSNMDLRLLVPFTDKSASKLVTWYINSFQMNETENAPERMCVYKKGRVDRKEERGGDKISTLWEYLVICLKNTKKILEALKI